MVSGHRISWTKEPIFRIGALLLALVAAAGPLAAAAVRDIDISDDRIVLHFDGAIEKVAAFPIEGPDRLAIDIVGATAGQGGTAAGPVGSVRHGQFDAQTARVVLSLTRPVLVSGGQFDKDGRTLTLMLAPASASAFKVAIAQGRKRFTPPLALAGLATALPSAPRLAAASAPRPEPSYSSKGRKGVTVPLGPVQGGTRLPRIYGAGTDRPLVVIDAGHGGHDPGAPSVLEGRHEKQATLPIALALRDALIESGRVRVALTREDDRFLVLGERREIARRLKADLFISIHADSAANASAKGASVYTLSEISSDKVAAQLAIKENRADILNGVDLGGETSDISSILIDLTQRETMNISSNFADLLQREMANNITMRARYHQFAGLVVLKAPDVPSVLVETGYMSNLDDATLLFSPEGQRKIASAIRRAVEVHFARRLAQR